MTDIIIIKEETVKIKTNEVISIVIPSKKVFFFILQHEWKFIFAVDIFFQNSWHAYINYSQILFPLLLDRSLFIRSFLTADPALRTAVNGISPPNPEKHELYIDVQPMMGTAMKARARIQVNLAVSQVRDIKQVSSFPDIIFPIMWFEDVSI